MVSTVIFLKNHKIDLLNLILHLFMLEILHPIYTYLLLFLIIKKNACNFLYTTNIYSKVHKYYDGQSTVKTFALKI